MGRAAKGKGYVEKQGYVRAQRRGHPTATANGKVFVHRANLYDAIGPGEHACHWCHKAIRWDVGRWEPDYLVTDHLDGVRDHNEPSNLVASCRSCNLSRRVWPSQRPHARHE